jgi:ribosomal protein L21E
MSTEENKVWSKLFPPQVGEKVLIADNPVIRDEYRGREATVVEARDREVVVVLPVDGMKKRVLILMEDWHFLSRVERYE